MTDRTDSLPVTDPAEPLTDAELDRILNLADAASVLPWRWDRGRSEVLCEEGILDADGEAVFVNCGRGTGELLEEDAAYLVAACNVLPALLREVRRLRAELAAEERAFKCGWREALQTWGIGWTPPDKYADDAWTKYAVIRGGPSL